jgi:uncharacterized protein
MFKFLSRLTLAMGYAGCMLLTHSLAESAKSPAAAKIEGIWLGTLPSAGDDLRVVLHVAKNGTGWTVTMDSPDQGFSGIPVSHATWSAGKLRLEMKGVSFFSGTLSADGDKLDGTFTQGMATLPLILNKIDRFAMPARPQTPKRPYPYTEETVTFPSAAHGVTLQGTLTMPKTPGPHTAVVLVAGSGPLNRDEFIAGGHRPFLVLSDYLTRRGFAVLRYDKRGVGKSTGRYTTATTADFADDAQAAVEYLRGRSGIASGHVGIFGHSEGGLIAPLVASRCEDVAFIVLSGAPGAPGDQLLVQQLEAMGREKGESEQKLAVRRANEEQLYSLVKKEADPVRLEADLNAAVARQISAAGSEDAALGSVGAGKKEVKKLMTPWFRYFIRNVDPKWALEKVTCPVLAIGGALDLQVPPSENLPVIAAALKAAGNPDFTVKELAGLNHLLQEAKTGSGREYSRIEQTMSPTAMKLIGDWIALHSNPPTPVGTGLRFLTSGPQAQDLWPCFSPDGKTVLFSRSVDKGRTWHLFIVSTLGGNPHLFATVPGLIAEMRPNWSPQTGRVAFNGTTADHKNGIWIVNDQGADARPVEGVPALAGYPSWYPDGKDLAFTDFSEFTIKRVGLTGGGGKLITDHTKVMAGMSNVSPDGGLIAFAGQENTGSLYDQTKNSIWLVGLDGKSRMLESDQAQGRAPSWSLDGKRLAFESNRTGTHKYYAVYIINRDGSGLAQVTPDELNGSHPIWSPHGTSLVFETHRMIGAHRETGIAIMDLP